MNKKEKEYFSALTKDRSEIADVLDRRAVRGYKDSVVEKYSDQAHFIYELLQNADDALATQAKFILEENRLIFSHNGSRHFSISNPSNEDIDSENNTLGDINAITSIANSSKKGASIGKFGVGFKAVFQYTSTPHIYDPDFKFKIERFIVPIQLDEDFPGRQSDETLFVFPFDHPNRNASESYDDIANKLKNLSYPLLFLNNLKGIKFSYNSTQGLYDKSTKTTVTLGDTTAEQLVLVQNNGDGPLNESLWLFSRQDDSGRKYSVGFFMDKEGHLKPVKKDAFCFFPTKEVTNLNFILHAPFLLTDSREGIRAGVPHNDKLIQLLAELAADSLEYLRDIGLESNTRLIEDNIVTIIPVDDYLFSEPYDKSKVSFLPFYQEIRKKFETSELLPTETGYVGTENAYWAEFPQLPQLFSNAQLADITGNKQAQWVFVSFGHYETNRNNKVLCTYLNPLVQYNLNEDYIINGRTREYNYNRVLGIRQLEKIIIGITPEFIEKQKIDWLHAFYKWISETKHRTDIITKKPIFLDQNGKAVAAYDENEQLILFMPVKNIDGYTVVNKKLLQNEDTKKFLEDLGIKEPSLKDQIYNTILPLYQKGGPIDTEPHFLMFFNYYCKCSNDEVDEFIQLIKDYEFLNYYDIDDNQTYRGTAASMYLPTPELRAYFETKTTTRFIDLAEYTQLVGKSKEKQLISFLTALGTKQKISVYKHTFDRAVEKRFDLPHPYSTRETTWTESVIDGCKEILECITEKQDEAKSAMLWNVLLKIIEEKCSGRTTLDTLLRGTVSYHYRTQKYEYFDSLDTQNLRNSCWLKSSNGEFVPPSKLPQDFLAKIYDKSTVYAEQLMDFLSMPKDYPAEKESEDGNLTDEQREKIAFANKLKAYGIGNDEDLAEYLEYKRKKETRNQTQPAIPQPRNPVPPKDGDDCNGTNVLPDDKHINKATTEVIKDIARRTKENPSPLSSNEVEENSEEDADELIPSSVDYRKKIERAKEKSAAEIDKITYFEELQTKAMEAPKYSYAWFQDLLEMEALNSGEANSQSREISISFAKVEREAGTNRTLVLKHPNRYIPHFMEDLADIPLVLHMGEQTKKLVIEVANIKSYTLRVKIKSAEDLANINLSAVTSATIDAKSPTFLLEELRKQFNELKLAPEYDMKENLCENIEFVFGPPGTGKTTHLAKNVLLPLMRNNSECKVLVLTPTNKAADVLVRRVMEVSCEDTSYEDWLVRFGATGDEEIEQSPVYRDKTFDIRSLSQSVTVTTIARFPYDYFMPRGARIPLYSLNWDYIIIDEASMIPLSNIIFPLYKKTPKKFIIAGDPFQIEPITSVDLWKDENIYKMVELKSFVKPTTKPHDYKVELLTTQYRSVPDIGTVFSGFAYGGILKHNRTADDQRQINFGEDLDIQTLNIIKFPVSKYESIYRCKRLQHSSSYQVYSALFTYEYVCFLSNEIAKNNPGEQIRIGIIAPYRAQADMIDKLLAAEKLPKDIDVQVGTIHGFQGDECDIIFAVFNTPPTISSSKQMFLNKTNIINVSISRARDYLFVVMPDDDTENINNLRLVKKVEHLIKDTDAWNLFSSSDLEELMFGDSKYLENNAFSTSHQSVNVYGLPEKAYEVRTEDDAVDVQVHKSPTPAILEYTHGIVPDDVSFELKQPTQNTYNPVDTIVPEPQKREADNLPENDEKPEVIIDSSVADAKSEPIIKTVPKKKKPKHSTSQRSSKSVTRPEAIKKDENKENPIPALSVPSDKANDDTTVTPEQPESSTKENSFTDLVKQLYQKPQVQVTAIIPDIQKSDTSNSPVDVKKIDNEEDYKPEDVAEPKEQTIGMLSQTEVIQSVDVQSETIERYVREGKLVPDLVVPITEQRTAKYFKPETLNSYAEKYGWKYINDANRKELFLEMIRHMDMSYSYKPVLIKAILKYADKKGRVKLLNIVAYFRGFYEGRRHAGLKVEKENSIFARGGYTDKEAERNILSNPFKRFADMQMLKRSLIPGIIQVDETVWQQLTATEKREIETICDKKLDEYYGRQC